MHLFHIGSSTIPTALVAVTQSLTHWLFLCIYTRTHSLPHLLFCPSINQRINQLANQASNPRAKEASNQQTNKARQQPSDEPSSAAEANDQPVDGRMSIYRWIINLPAATQLFRFQWQDRFDCEMLYLSIIIPNQLCTLQTHRTTKLKKNLKLVAQVSKFSPYRFMERTHVPCENNGAAKYFARDVVKTQAVARSCSYWYGHKSEFRACSIKVSTIVRFGGVWATPVHVKFFKMRKTNDLEALCSMSPGGNKCAWIRW